MAEYIEREALLAEYDRLHTGEPGRARQMIADAPTIDAVPVVRCEKCRFGTNPIPTHGVRQCGQTFLFHPDDWYCPNGRRKDGE